MRTRKSAVNLIVACTTQMINVLLQFLLRTLFIRVLSTEYLGLNGLFSNILSFLSFAELGFGASITFSLYKPLAANDEKAVAGIMNFFKRVYWFVGIFVLVCGISLTPLLPWLIHDMPDIPHLNFIYILWVLNSGISYFGVYKSTLIIADQRRDIVDKNSIIFKILQLLLQAVVLFVSKNYVLYLVLQVCMTVSSNISISIIADKRFSYLRKYRKERIDKKSLEEIKRNVGATILHKLGAVVIFGTDNILLSKYFGLVVVGMYSNYYLIINTLTNLVGQIQGAIIASVGNLGATESNQKKLEVFEQYCFLNFWVFCFTAACLLALLDPFIRLWIGDGYTIPFAVVFVLVLNYFLTGFRSAAATFDNAFGLFWNTRKLPVVESFLNIVFSLILAKIFGYIGIFMGTTLSSVMTGTWFEPYVLYKEGFKYPVSSYYRRLVEYFVVAGIVAVSCLFGVSRIAFDGILGMAIKSVTAGVLSNLLLVIFYFRTKRARYIFGIIRKLIGSKKGNNEV